MSFRSSSTRFLTSALETAKELLGRRDEGARLRGLEPLARVDPAPADRDGVDSGPPRRLDVPGRVADVRRRLGPGVEQLERPQDAVRVRLVARHVVARDDGVEE